VCQIRAKSPDIRACLPALQFALCSRAIVSESPGISAAPTGPTHLQDIGRNRVAEAMRAGASKPAALNAAANDRASRSRSSGPRRRNARPSRIQPRCPERSEEAATLPDLRTLRGGNADTMAAMIARGKTYAHSRNSGNRPQNRLDLVEGWRRTSGLSLSGRQHASERRVPTSLVGRRRSTHTHPRQWAASIQQQLVRRQSKATAVNCRKVSQRINLMKHTDVSLVLLTKRILNTTSALRRN
jgi:hypothetical protein